MFPTLNLIFKTQDRRKAWSGIYDYGSPNTIYSVFGGSCTKKPFQVAGESGLGKTTFINTLFSTTIKNYADHRRRHAKQVDKTVEIEITKAELEEKFFKGPLRNFGHPHDLSSRLML
jgi:hypothetical protein